MNWPIAFVFAVAICAGAFLYNKPSEAAFGSSHDVAVAFTQSEGASAVRDKWIQFESNKQRKCFHETKKFAGLWEIKCLPWKTD